MKDLKSNLESILKDLEVEKTFSRESLYDNCINAKLKNSMDAYTDDVNLTTDYLLQRAGEKVLKSLKKIQKQKDTEELKKYLNENNN